MNVELLRKVRAHILEEPARLVMETVCHRLPVGSNFGMELELSRPVPACGTVACIAGWTVLLHDAEQTKSISDLINALTDAGDLLGLNNNEASRLFWLSGWPAKFRVAWHNSESLAERAKITSDRIDFFITTRGTDYNLEIRN